MTDKERLVEILEKAGSMRQYPGTMARILIENGVTFGKDTNVLTKADRIRAMSDEELADFIRLMVDEDCTHELGCYGCINYGTHHSDPANKGTHLYECEGCPNEDVGLDIVKWLQQPVED